MNTESYGDALDGALKEIARLHEVNQELLGALKEAEYALDYASDMTKPEGLSGCDCPICSVSIKIRTAIAKAGGSNEP